MKKLVGVFIAITICTTILFVGLHRHTNTAPKGLILERVTQAFKNDNFSQYDYPFSSYGPFSMHGLVGQNHYTECELALSAMSNTGHRLREAVLPSITTIKTAKGGYCNKLSRIIENPQNPEIEIERLRTRYWWGGAAIMGTSLRYVNVFQLKELIKKTTTFALVLLSVALIFIGKKVFFILSPLLFFSIFLSGTTYYTDVALGVPFIWGIFVAGFLSLTIALSAKRQLVYYFLFFAGTVSSFIWLIDGHLMMVTSWILLICYYSESHRNPDSSETQAFVFSLKALLIFILGFVCSYTAGQLIKAIYIGIDPIWISVKNAVLIRTSSSRSSGVEIDFGNLIDSLWFHGFVWSDALLMEKIASVIASGSVLALLCGFILTVLCSVRDRKLFLSSVLIILIMAHFIIRIYVMKNHSAIHPFFIGRYLFIPLALCWVLFLSSLLDYKKHS